MQEMIFKNKNKWEYNNNFLEYLKENFKNNKSLTDIHKETKIDYRVLNNIIKKGGVANVKL